MSWQEYHARYIPIIEQDLQDTLTFEARHDALGGYYGMMHYHMGWRDERLRPVEAPRGKRFRPLLCLLVCEAVGGDIERALPAATAIELLHNFSLIHDDIEDNSAFRRHRPALWKVWGLAHGINCGDGLFAHAILQLSRLPERGVSPERSLRAQRAFMETCIRLTEGQYLDLSFEQRIDVSLDAYLEMIRGKTAALISCSTFLGALVGGADEATLQACAAFGENLGLAFQVIDDILGIWGREEETGKPSESDIVERKKTLPIVYALHDPELRDLYSCDSLDESQVSRVVAILERHKAREFAVGMARRYSEQALEHLRGTGQETPPHRAILELTRYLLGRVA